MYHQTYAGLILKLIESNKYDQDTPTYLLKIKLSAHGQFETTLLSRFLSDMEKRKFTVNYPLIYSKYHGSHTQFCHSI